MGKGGKEERDRAWHVEMGVKGGLSGDFVVLDNGGYHDIVLASHSCINEPLIGFPLLSFHSPLPSPLLLY